MNHCCTAMEDSLVGCRWHPDPWECPDAVIVKAEDGSIGLPIRDGGASYIAIDHCPWCGVKLYSPEDPDAAL